MKAVELASKLAIATIRAKRLCGHACMHALNYTKVHVYSYIWFCESCMLLYSAAKGLRKSHTLKLNWDWYT